MNKIEKQLIQELVIMITPEKDEEIRKAVYTYLTFMIDNSLIKINKEALEIYKNKHREIKMNI